MSAIPDVPKDIKVQIDRRNEMEKQMLFQDEDESRKSNFNPNHG